MNRLVALCDGHGLSTAGKRTPKFDDGTQILENEFNHATKLKLFEVLKRCSIPFIDVAPGQTDIPLATRIKTANDNNAAIYVSIHYNALNEVWGGTAGGIEVLYHHLSTNGKKLAEMALRHIVLGTSMPNRGIKPRNDLAVLNQTKMPAIIAECGFMDVYSQAILMRNEQYQWESAEELGAAICEYLGVPYVEPKFKFARVIDILNQLTNIVDSLKKEIDIIKE